MSKIIEYDPQYEADVKDLLVELQKHLASLDRRGVLVLTENCRNGYFVSGYLIFGHIHNKVLPEYKPLFSAFNALNTGVDVNHFEPVSFADLVKNNEEFSKIALEQLGQLNE